jgi:hypothetical protein
MLGCEPDKHDVFVVKILKGEKFSPEQLSEEVSRLRIPPAVKSILEHIVVHIGFELAREYIRGG